MNDVAKNKINANITTLQFKLRSLEDNYKNRLFGGISKDEFKLIIDGTKKEINIWEYIKTKLI